MYTLKIKSTLGRIKDNLISRSRHKKPSQIVIETTNKCNLNCPFCLVGMQNELQEKHGNASHNLMTRPMGTMTPGTFARVREELKSFGIKKAYLHFQGEPFLNKHTPDFARQLKADKFFVGIFTNGQAFTDKIIEDIARVEIDLIRFSVDGASEETYQQNRVGGKFSTVYKNMQKVAQAHKAKRTRIEWQFLPLRNNEHEVEEARKLANELKIHFFAKGFRETDPELAPRNPKLRSRFLTKPCIDIYKQLGVYWNGDVVPCCYDVDAKEVMGNIHEDDLETIWNSSKYKAFRERVDKFKSHPQDEPQICKSCLRWR